MIRHGRFASAALAIVAGAAVVLSLVHAWGKEEPAAADKERTRPDPPEVAAIRKTAAAFAKAFNSGDAKAVAAFWTKDGEYVGPDGDTLRGRAAITKGYAEFMKNNPGARLEVTIDSVRLLGRHTALEEGTLKLVLPDNPEPGVSRYSVLHVREEDGWRMASVREWVPDPQELVSLKDVAWLLGDWVARADKDELRIRYSWDEGGAFLRGRYTLKRDGKVFSSGTQIIGKDPRGGLRSWIFDSGGVFGESGWTRDGDRWVIEAGGTLPDGSEVTAVNFLIPTGKDSFTWQSVERTAAGSPLPDTPPLKVTRVKAEK